MKTVKEVSMITGISIRTLRYYDEIGLLKPTELTETGYRLYDNKALEKLQAILFFRELEIPLIDIKKIMDAPNYDKEQILITQKALLEQKRNRSNFLCLQKNAAVWIWSGLPQSCLPKTTKMFALDNARSILLDLSKEYLQNAKLAEVTDNQFGAGCSESLANAIKRYYGV